MPGGWLTHTDNAGQAVVLIKIPHRSPSTAEEDRNRKIRFYHIELWSSDLVCHLMGSKRDVIEMFPICMQSIPFRRDLFEVDSENPENQPVIIPCDTILKRYEEDNNFDPFVINANDLKEMALHIDTHLKLASETSRCVMIINCC